MTHPSAPPPRIRLTGATRAILDVLATANPDDPPWGLRICQQTELGSGTVYPVLERLAEAGWLDAWLESEQPAGRPRRRFYLLNNTGRAGMAAALAAREARRRQWKSFMPKAAAGGAG
jgi:PadR family transcriptional regulator PadR